MKKILLIITTIAITACSTPPKPPTATGYKQDINSTESVQLLQISSDLIRIEERINQELSKRRAPESLKIPPQIINIYFPYNSARFLPTTEQEVKLIRAIEGAKRIDIRGRTDGKYPTKGDAKIALNRAVAAKQYLVDRGIPPNIITINYISADDYIANNSSAYRYKNRRAEIEIHY